MFSTKLVSTHECSYLFLNIPRQTQERKVCGSYMRPRSALAFCSCSGFLGGVGLCSAWFTGLNPGYDPGSNVYSNNKNKMVRS